MDTIYKILLVEDELYDAELNMREIRKLLPLTEFRHVDNKLDYIKMLEEFNPDVIISDYNMPSFDGLTALAIVRGKYPFLPFIIVTGSINEDTAVECMKAGATDYVLKESLKRLGSAILSAIEQSNLRVQKYQSEKRLKESEQSYLGLFNSVSEAIYILNIHGKFIAVNKGTEKMYGYPANEIIGQTPEYLSAPGMNDLSIISESLNRIFETGETIQFEFWGKRKNGAIFLEEVVCNKGEYFGKEVIIATAREITERKLTEEKLNNERKLLRTLINNLPATIYVKDSECRKIIANSADIDVIGAKSEEEVLGKTDLETFNNDIGARGYADDKQVIESGIAVLNREEDFVDAKGLKRWLLTSKIPLTDATGKIVGLVGIGRDITDQKQAQEKIIKLSKGIEQSPVTFVITDIEGTIEYVNSKFSETTGYTEQEAIGKNPRFLKSELMPNELYADLWRTIKSGNVWKGEIQNKKKDGTYYWEEATITPIRNDKGLITNFIAIKEDITERKKMQAELIEAKEKAEESDRLKSAFLANMSHEIRTPLNSIIGFAELLNDPDFDGEQKEEFIRTIVDNGNRLLVIISDIMDFSMLEANQMKIRNEVFSVRNLLNDLLIDFNKTADEKGIEIRVDHFVDGSDILIESDKYRIRQIFNNLIGNALKFTEKGYIEIGFKLRNEMIEFHVKDSGIGIAPEHHEAVFDRFRQVDLAKNRKYGGNGLGLAITKNLVKLLGGNIWIESEQNKYSDFFFTIPKNSR